MTKVTNADVLEWIEKNESRWDQRSFVLPGYKLDDNGREVESVCNSSFCYAGTALFLAGQVIVEDGAIKPTYPNGTTDRYCSWEDEAAKLLGLNSDQAFTIFYTITDDFAEFKELVQYVIDHPDDLNGMLDAKARCLGENEDEDGYLANLD